MACRALSRAGVIAWSVVVAAACSGGGSKAGPSEPTWAVRIPQTGQTVSKAAGDDGALQRGLAWPEPRFTEADSGLTVVDRLTGLMWARTITPVAECGWQSFNSGDPKSWPDALAYVACLNSRSYLGHDDWRMPNRVEMISLVQNSAIDCDGGYPHQQWLAGEGFRIEGERPERPTLFFTSTVEPNREQCVARESVTHVWLVTWCGASWTTGYSSGSTVRAVWPVRDAEGVQAVARLPATGITACYGPSCERIDCAGTGQDGETRKGVAWPSPRFETNEDTTVTDRLTGLVWAPNGNLPNEPVDAAVPTTWEEALAVVEGLNQNAYLGHNDWRLPNIRELGTLGLGDTETSDLTEQLRAAGVTVAGGFYWSSTWEVANTASEPDLRGAWAVRMLTGEQRIQLTGEEPDRAQLLPVRGP